MNQSAHFLALSGALSQLLLPAGLVAYQLRIHSTITAVAVSQETNDVDQIMATIDSSIGQMGNAFGLVLWCLGLAMAGLIPFLIAITRLRYRRTWAFWFSCIYGGCLIGLFPPFGLFLLIFALMHRQEFAPTFSPPGIA